jgi:hypothetical protein
MNAFVITSGVAIFIVLVLYYINKDELTQFRSDQDAPRYKYGLGYTDPKRIIS